MSIKKALKNYSDTALMRWHTPGHKGSLDTLDITEIDDGDFFPSNLVIKAQSKTAEFYNAKQCRYLVNGSSAGIKAFLLALKGDVIVHSYCHRAVTQGVSLSGSKVFYIELSDDNDGLPQQVTLESVKKAIQENPTAKAVILESPDYYGRVISREIVDYIKSTGKLFYCDSAHGAHLNANTDIFPPSYSGVADACNLSAHKTLDSYTQTAYLCINNDSLIDNIDTALENLSTSSPSYIFLSSLEEATLNAIKSGDKYKKLYDNILEFKKKINCYSNDDFTRILVDATSYGLDSRELALKLQEQKIYVETTKGNYVIFIATPHETKKDFDKLANAILSVSK